MSNKTNPIFAPYTTPYGAYPFDQIQLEDYRLAFAEAIAEKRQEIEAIINNPETPSFENTILALEQAGSKLELLSGIFYNLLHAHSNDELMEISEEVTPTLSDLSSWIILSEPLFERIRQVYNQREQAPLTSEELRLLTRYYEDFAEQGALLSAEQKQRLRELSCEMSESTLLYGQNTLRDQKRFKLYIQDNQPLQGLPESLLNLGSELAKREGKTEGYLFDLTAPSYIPFMQHCRDRNLRQQMYLAKLSVGAIDNEFDNKPLIHSITSARLEKAQLLGYPCYADYVLRKRMAQNTERVYKLLDELLEAYKPIAEQELQAISTFAQAQGQESDLQPWDWSYWAEQYKQAHYELDDEMLRPYFELDTVSEAVFGLATTLYGITFHQRQDIPIYHPDVRVYEVKDHDGSYLGLLYTDFFPRESKQSGAWMNNLQEQYHTSEGQDHRPHIVLVMNFTPPTEGTPSLLTADEVQTFLHEFGHALHGLFAQGRFASLSGTNVTRDFVELPSQLMENWFGERAWLSSWAKHYQTGEVIPENYIKRMEQAKHFLTGYATCRQLSFGYLDMAWHTLQAPLRKDEDLKTFEDTAWAKALVLPSSPQGTMMSTSFGHIFSGGYAAGYYGYKWAEVLDADAFALFLEEGLFNTTVAERFRKEILSQGDKRDAEELYLAFRGKAPSIQALLARDGIRVAQ